MPLPSPVPEESPEIKDVSKDTAKGRGAGKSPRGRRVPRWLLVALVVTLGLGGGYWLLTGSFATRWIVLSQAEGIVGGPVQASSVELHRDGTVVIEDGVVRAPGVPGEAGVVFQVERLEARLDYWSLFSGEPEVFSVRLVKPLARVSQSCDDGSLNVGALAKGSGSGSVPRRLPAIEVEDGAIELGEHGSKVDGGYERLRRISVAGEVEQKAEAPGEWRIGFRQTEPGPIPTPINVEGLITKDTLSLSLDGIDLGGWDVSSVPTPTREVFKKLDMSGRLEQAQFTYYYDAPTPEEAVEASMRLADVAMTLPLEPRPDVDRDNHPLPMTPEQAATKLRMTGVHGTLSIKGQHANADFTGMLDDVPLRMQAQMRGLSAEAGFTVDVTTEEFRLTKKPAVLRFAPGMVRVRLEQFDDPTGLVKAAFTVSRADPTKGPDGAVAAEVKMRGAIKFRGVESAFERFPYRFYELSGVADFADDFLHIRDITGSTPEGATVAADVYISPLDDNPGVKVHVQVDEMPIDERLARAMGVRRRIVDALFSPQRLDELRSAGLIATDADVQSAERMLADLTAEGREQSAQAEAARRVLALPRFTLGGRADVDVNVERVLGEGSNWHDHIVVDPSRLGLLPEKFPMPMWVEGVKVEKKDALATVSGGTYTTLSMHDGKVGTAQIGARVDFSQVDDPTQPFLPEVELDARGVPLDSIVRHAVADLMGESEAGSTRSKVRDALISMRTGGTVDVEARMGPANTNAESGSDGGPNAGATGGEATRAQDGPQSLLSRMTYDVLATLHGASVEPPGPNGGSPRVRIFGVDGTARLGKEKLEVAIEGALTRIIDASEGSQDGAPAVAPVADLRLEVAGDGQGTWVELGARGLDLAAPVEDVGAVAFPSVHEKVAQVRSELAPQGRADLQMTLDRPEDGAATLALDVNKLDGAQITAIDGRIAMTSTAGALSARMKLSEDATADTGDGSADTGMLGDAVIRAAEFGVSMTFNGAPAGEAVVTGAVRGDGTPIRGENGAAGVPLVVTVRDAMLESGLVRGVLGKVAAGVGDTVKEYDAGGRFDATITMRPKGDGELGAAAKDGQGDWRVEADVRPKSLAGTLDGTRVVAHTASGLIEIRDDRGRVIDAELTGDAWSARGNATWLKTPAAGGAESATETTAAQARLSIHADRLTPEVVGALPKGLREAIQRANVQTPGGIDLQDGEVAVAMDANSKMTSFRVAGRVKTDNAEGDLGVSLRELAATAEFQYAREGPSEAPKSTSLDVVATAPHLRIGGVEMTDARARLTQGKDGAIYLPAFSADCHGGRISGSGSLITEGTGEAAKRRIQADASASSVRFASLLEDLGASAKSNGERVEVQAADGSRGLLDASLSVSTVLGEPDARRGRGSATVGGGRVMSLPLLVPLIRVSNLQLPLNERLDFARAEFFFDGKGINFEELLVSSSSVEIYGFGTASWPEANLDLRFRSRAKTRIPVVSNLIEKLRDELVTAVVEGPIAEPVVTVTTLTGTSRFVGRVLGMEPSEQARRLEEIQKRAEQRRGDDTGPRTDTAPVEME